MNRIEQHTPHNPVLQFPTDFDERGAWETENKGGFEGASLAFPNGVNIQLSFWGPVRLNQDLETAIENGGTCFAEPFLIIVPTVTRSAMEKAVTALLSQGISTRSSVSQKLW